MAVGKQEVDRERTALSCPDPGAPLPPDPKSKPPAYPDTATGPALDSLWTFSMGSVKVSLMLATLILSIAELARARRGDGVSLLGALGLYLQVTALSVLVANALRPLWRWMAGAVITAFLAAIAPSVLTLWLLERLDLRQPAGAGGLLLHGLALAAMLSIPIGIALVRAARSSTTSCDAST